MKNTINKLITFVVFLCIVASPIAHAETSILFRDIPWFSSPTETLELLKSGLGKDDLDIKYAIVDSERVTQHARNYDAYSGSSILFDRAEYKGPVGYHGPTIPMLICKICVPNLEVAGYKVYDDVSRSLSSFSSSSKNDYRNIYLYFLPVLSEDRRSYEISQDVGMLWRAEYARLCQPHDISYGQMKDDLYGRLRKLYGSVSTGHISELAYVNSKWSCVTTSFDYWTVGGATVDIAKTNIDGFSLDYRADLDRMQNDIDTIAAIVEEEKVQADQNKMNEVVGSSSDGL